MKLALLLFISFFFSFNADCQSLESEIDKLYLQMTDIEKQKAVITNKLEDLKLFKIQQDLQTVGLPSTFPGDLIVKHSAYTLAYVEKYEQARWVAHIVIPDVTTGTVFRTNDFRPDSMVTTGSAIESDYFLKKLKSDSTYEYDAFGYDRGHLAPSADFRWSSKALSESYLYSNMSPQLPEFNREKWAALEDALRGYLYRNKNTQLYIVTGPILDDSLSKIERGTNKVTIPKYFWKIAYDPANQRSIGFIMPNKKINEPLETFSVPIGTVEKRTGLSFFTKLPADLKANLENQRNIADWISEIASGDVESLSQELLPRGYFNSVVAKNYMDQNTIITVAGKVVGARVSKAGNLIINLDKQFPNQIFSVFIKKEDLANFSYNGEKFLKDKVIAIKGKVISLGGTPTMYVDNEKQIAMFDKQ